MKNLDEKTANMIIQEVYDYFGIVHFYYDHKEPYEKTCFIVSARYLCAFLFRTCFGLSYEKIGKILRCTKKTAKRRDIFTIAYLEKGFRNKWIEKIQNKYVEKN